MKALVSIIVPVYNVQAYLERCVISLENQTYRNVEIILVDDGSTDGSGALCDSLKERDSRIQVIHKENGGLSDARNTGLKAANGDYVIYIDSDDYVGLNMVKACLERITQDESDLLIFDLIRVEDNQESIDTIHELKSGCYRLKEEKKILLSSPSACNKMFRRDFLLKSGVTFPVGKHYEDLGTIPKLFLLANKISYIKKAFYYYVLRSGSIMTGQVLERNYRDRTEMIDRIIKFYQEKGEYQTFYNELSWMTFLNGYFLPSKETILSDYRNKGIRKFKQYMYKRFPDFKKNPYRKNLSKKDGFHLWTIDSENYWIMILFSKLRKLKETILG
ncbi:glycosyltransferase involved in cell wall biosynthesis [Aequitasia blattaphilus]|uniref:Glycosyltransferase n=1 Tax=Aequitasia blattaphilus TaxID=2949332 RepID=A0ABT1E606_9FIRM|nr:glycosyltransferase [Aequitasia blattaphilus]MCP1101266.1 glycosyltransferase [Aequitasia blattaphilus]MCR8613906.1 glycosyltransferase [Aequitasia blattaphilus]